MNTLARNRPLERRAPLRKANPARLAKLRAHQFGAHAASVACLPCATCRPDFYTRYDDQTIGDILALAANRSLPRVSDPHHAVHTRGAGGTAEHVTPLCRAHHRQVESLGRVTFARKHRVRLKALARRLARVSPLPPLEA